MSGLEGDAMAAVRAHGARAVSAADTWAASAMVRGSRPRSSRTLRNVTMRFVLAGVLTGWAGSVCAAEPAATDERLSLARDYVATGRVLALFDRMVSADPPADPDDRMLTRILRDAPREVMNETLAQGLAKTASVAQLREALDYVRSDAGRFESECYARWRLEAGQPPNCFKDDVDNKFFPKIVKANLGAPGEVRVLAVEPMETALWDALQVLKARDAEVARFMVDYCSRNPDIGLCVGPGKGTEAKAAPSQETGHD
ncbi:hypothetical protein [Lysobacter sp. Root604]|uniref:hypothetical protein n=1 Tax=Lysobacter sp. Root604 TaxID=1736568 RepID=UPI0006F93740|nr:hypothetical protein [Lysobacter sp. Root604]KRA20526.1 hypothetical protein ASD69_04125 [Lysobacter sp. Root604]